MVGNGGGGGGGKEGNWIAENRSVFRRNGKRVLEKKRKAERKGSRQIRGGRRRAEVGGLLCSPFENNNSGAMGQI